MNHIIIAGRVDSDPVRKEVNDSVVCTFRLASRPQRHQGREALDRRRDLGPPRHLLPTCGRRG